MKTKIASVRLLNRDTGEFEYLNVLYKTPNQILNVVKQNEEYYYIFVVSAVNKSIPIYYRLKTYSIIDIIR